MTDQEIKMVNDQQILSMENNQATKIRELLIESNAIKHYTQK
jgi:hypothetical protein